MSRLSARTGGGAREAAKWFGGIESAHGFSFCDMAVLPVLQRVDERCGRLMPHPAFACAIRRAIEASP